MSLKKRVWIGAAIVGAGVVLASGAYSFVLPSTPQSDPSSSHTLSPMSASPAAVNSLELKSGELEQFKIQPAEERVFSIQREAVGNIDFNEEMSTDVFPPVAGKILKLFAKAGDDVKAGAPLYTIDSPDLSAAASNLISAAGVLELTTRALKRAEDLFKVQGFAQRDLEQAISDQQGAEAALKAARDAVRIFGKTEAEMDAIVSQRKIDSELVVPAPITGRVTARNAAPGVLAQPGNAPAPYTLSDVSTLWMLADVAESDFASLKLGQAIEVSVKAYPGRVFPGKLVNIGASVDPASRRVTVRSEIADPNHELRSGMFANFVIKIGEQRSASVPQNGVVREGDGTRSVWVATDQKSLVHRKVSVGLQQNGFFQILEGLRPGEPVATHAALFLSNELVETSK